MPRITLPLPETYENVTRPVVYEITRQLLKHTGLPIDTPILFPDDSETTYQPGSTMTKQGLENNFGANARLFIEMEEEYDPDRIMSTAVDTPENLWYFWDEKLEIYMKPAYTHQQMTLNFKYRAPDKTAALKWRDDIRARVSRGRDVFLHTASYSHDIPEEFLHILRYLHELREKQGGYGQEYDAYFQEFVTPRATIKTNLAGKWQTWTVPETQQRIQGWFDFEGAPEKGSKEGELEAWTISFTYRFAYEKPFEAVMQYPLMIHNQILNKKYRQTTQDLPKHKRPEFMQQAYTSSVGAFHVFEKGSVLERVCKLEGVTIPEIDEWLPQDVLPGTLRAFTAMVAVNPEEPRYLASLDQLHNHYEIHPEVLKYLKDEATYATRLDQSVFQLSLYRSNYLQSQRDLVMDSNLVVRATYDLDIREQYHIRLGLVKDIRSLGSEVKRRFREHGKAALVILDAIDCSLKGKGLLPPLIGDDYIGEKDLDDALEEINRDVISSGNGQQYIFVTVGTFFIQSLKKE